MKVWPKKDPDASLAYAFDWMRWLNGDAIVSAEWTIPAGITKVSQSETQTHTTVVISGGTPGRHYDCAVRITTATGQTDDRTARLRIKER